MYYSEYSQGIMKNPDIANLVTKDLYLSPMSLEVPQDYSDKDVVNISKGETMETKGIKVKFIDFDRSKFNRDAMKEGKESVMGATLEVTADGKKETITAEQKISQGNTDNLPVQLSSNDRYTFYLTNISVQNESKVGIAVVDNTLPKSDQSPETLVLTASIKPYINLVWGGTIVMVLGFFTALLNRYRLIKLENKKEELLTVNGNGNWHNKTNGFKKKSKLPEEIS